MSVLVHHFASHADSQKDFELISNYLEDLIARFRSFSDCSERVIFKFFAFFTRLLFFLLI